MPPMPLAVTACMPSNKASHRVPCAQVTSLTLGGQRAQRDRIFAATGSVVSAQACACMQWAHMLSPPGTHARTCVWVAAAAWAQRVRCFHFGDVRLRGAPLRPLPSLHESCIAAPCTPPHPPPPAPHKPVAAPTNPCNTMQLNSQSTKTEATSLTQWGCPSARGCRAYDMGCRAALRCRSRASARRARSSSSSTRRSRRTLAASTSTTRTSGAAASTCRTTLWRPRTRASTSAPTASTMQRRVRQRSWARAVRACVL